MFLNYPIEIWAVCLIATLVRMKNVALPLNTFVGIYSFISTGLVSVLSGVFLHKSIADYLDMGPSSYLFIAVLIALTSENIMKNIAVWSEKFSVGDFITNYLTKGKGS